MRRSVNVRGNVSVNVDERGRVIDHHKPIWLFLEPIKGYYMPEFGKLPIDLDYKSVYDFSVKNKGYRNFAYALNAYFTNIGQPVISTGGESITFNSNDEIGASFASYGKLSMYPTYINYGSYTSPHDVSRYELYGAYWSQGGSGIWWQEELDTETRWQTKHLWAFSGVNRSVGEVGLYFRYPRDDGRYWLLFARAIIDPPVEKTSMTLFDEGWRITFPANYTRWFLRAKIGQSPNASTVVGLPITATDGTTYIAKSNTVFAASPDARIGRSNLAPSPTHYNLQNPIGSLSSQSQSVEIDTTLQECRIVRTGTYTPSVNETLGEIGLFINVCDVSGTARTIMVARGIWDPVVTLVAGTTYTIGIVLRLG